MKVMILAGGLGTRLSEETDVSPKPMVEIGGKPILWHIMKTYSHYGFNEFVILLGYKGYLIKEYFANYFLHQSDVTFDLSKNHVTVHNNMSEPWKVTLLGTGLDTMTGGRILRAKSFVENETFLLTYGDGVSNINVNKLLEFHRCHDQTLTMTIVYPEGRYGFVETDSEGNINFFEEKPENGSGRINGGFFVCQPEVFDYIKEGDATVFERGPIEEMARKGVLCGYKHDGFWMCMDTLRDKKRLNNLWQSGNAPWKEWCD